MRVIWFVIFVFITMQGCLHSVNLESESNYDPQITVFCILTPEKPIQVFVHHTLNYGGFASAGGYLQGATVRIKRSDTAWDTLQSPLEGEMLYSLNDVANYVVPGVDYHLEVSCPGYNTVYASTTLPRYADTWDTLYKSELIDVPGDLAVVPGYQIRGEWNQQNNYDYKNVVQCWHREFRFDEYDSTSEIAYFQLSDNEVLRNMDGRWVYFHEFEASIFPSEDLKTDVFLITPDKNLDAYNDVFEYFETIANTENNDLGLTNLGLVLEFTNVENGYGVFGSYLSNQRTIYY